MFYLLRQQQKKRDENKSKVQVPCFIFRKFRGLKKPRSNCDFAE